MKELKIQLILVIFISFFVSQVNAKIIFVKHNATGLNNGTSWENAYLFLQDAITFSSIGDSIWISEGTYFPDLGIGKTLGARFESFNVPCEVHLFGGFAGNELEFNQRDISTYLTILSGNIGNPAIETDNSYAIVQYYNCLDTTILDGIVIKNSYNDQIFGGGGISGYNSRLVLRDLKIEDNIFNNNLIDSISGGIFLQSDSSIIMRCKILNNEAYGNKYVSGGIILVGGKTMITECEIQGNKGFGAEFIGGGLLTTYNDIVIDSSCVNLNEGYSNNSLNASAGGGLMLHRSNITGSNNQIENNKSEAESLTRDSYAGGGIMTDYGSVFWNFSSISSNKAFSKNDGYNGTIAYAGGGILNRRRHSTFNAAKIINNYASAESTNGIAMSGGGGAGVSGSFDLFLSEINGNLSYVEGPGNNYAVGGIFMQQNQPYLFGCEFNFNIGFGGYYSIGGAYFEKGLYQCENTNFIDNIGSSRTNLGIGGVYLESEEGGKFINVNIIGNSADTSAAAVGGIYNKCSGMEFTNVNITNNSAEDSGYSSCGGMYNSSDSEFYKLEISNNLASTNTNGITGSSIGGLSTNKNSTFYNLWIHNNTAKVNGAQTYASSTGGMTGGLGNSFFFNSIIENNNAELITDQNINNIYNQFSIGGIRNNGNFAYFNTVVINNSAYTESLPLNSDRKYACGGILNYGGNKSFYYNCNILNNSGQGVNVVTCGGILNSFTEYEIKNSILYNNIGDFPDFKSVSSGVYIDSCIVQTDYKLGQIIADPLFYNLNDPDGPDNTWWTEDDGLRIKFGSPALNSGMDYIFFKDYKDIDGDGNTSEDLPYDFLNNPRYFACSIDIGAYEYQYSNEIYVNHEAIGNNSGESLQNAFNNFPSQIYYGCDEPIIIRVSNGEYLLEQPINIKSPVEIFGGFEGVEYGSHNDTTMIEAILLHDFEYPVLEFNLGNSESHITNLGIYGINERSSRIHINYGTLKLKKVAIK